jgi:hypothetical protein
MTIKSVTYEYKAYMRSTSCNIADGPSSRHNTICKWGLPETRMRYIDANYRSYVAKKLIIIEAAGPGITIKVRGDAYWMLYGKGKC